MRTYKPLERYTFKAEDECVLFGYCKKNIQRCCRGERKTHKGYIWSYEPL